MTGTARKELFPDQDRYSVGEKINSGEKISHFKVRLCSPEQIESAWEYLETKGNCWAFQTRAWVYTWLETVGKSAAIEPRLILVESSYGRPLAVLPLGIQRRRGVRCLVWLGGALADYLGPLLSPDFHESTDADAYLRLWRDICSSAGKFDAIVFERQPEMIAEQPNPFVFDKALPHTCNAHSLVLPESLDDLLKERRSASWRSKERRKERRLSEQGELRFRIAETPADANSILPTLFRQKSISYQDLGARDFFNEPQYRDFVSRLSTERNDSLFVYLCALSVDERMLATFWGLVFDNRFYHLLPTYEKCELTRYAPGNLLLRHMFQWAIDHEIKSFDFTSGDDQYKSLWCDCELKLYDYFESQTLKGWLYLVSLQSSNRLKNFVKNSTTLLNIARRIRSIVGARRKR